jgi:hypothetical protein
MAAFWFRIERSVLRPWLAGMVLLAGVIWGISWLLDTQQIEGAAADDEVAGGAPSTAVAAAPGGMPSNAAAVPLADLLPLGPEDDGFRVKVRGTVVAEPITEGVWILTDEDEVLFALTAKPAASGQDLTLTGTLHQVAAAEGAARAAQAKLREAAGWKVHHNLYLLADAPARDTAAVLAAPRDTTT